MVDGDYAGPVAVPRMAGVRARYRGPAEFNWSLADQECMRDPHWYAFLCSSLITFFSGLLLVLSWRILSWLFCQQTVAIVSTKSSVGRRYADDRSANGEVGWVTEAKDWAGELISGQTTTGRILVSIVERTDLSELYNSTVTKQCRLINLLPALIQLLLLSYLFPVTDAHPLWSTSNNDNKYMRVAGGLTGPSQLPRKTIYQKF